MSSRLAPIAPEIAGCNAKLPFSLTLLLKSSLAGGSDIGDFHFARLPDGGYIFTSIDKTGLFCSDLAFFARCAINHALRDIISAGATLVSIDVAFEFGNDLPTEHDKIELVRQVEMACSELGVELGKCHSTFSSITQLCVSVAGYKRETNTLDLNAGSIYLSHPLGSFRQVYLAAQGHSVGFELISRGFMSRSFLEVSRIISDLSIYATDVSGFGLSGSLSLAQRSHSIFSDIALPPEVVFAVDEELSAAICIHSDPPADIDVSDYQLSVSTLREVAGPLLLFCPKEKEVSFLSMMESNGLQPIVIGTFFQSAERQSGKIK